MDLLAATAHCAAAHTTNSTKERLRDPMITKLRGWRQSDGPYPHPALSSQGPRQEGCRQDRWPDADPAKLSPGAKFVTLVARTIQETRYEGHFIARRCRTDAVPRPGQPCRRLRRYGCPVQECGRQRGVLQEL